MKKIWLTFLTAFLLAVAMSSSALAAGWLPMSDVALGGITLEMTQDAVENIYGQPTKSTDRGILRYDGCHHVVWQCGDSFVIDFAGGYVDSIKTFGINGIKTPAGIHVASAEIDILNTYGEPWLRNSNGRHLIYWYHTEKDRKLFIDVLYGRVASIVVAYE